MHFESSCHRLRLCACCLCVFFFVCLFLVANDKNVLFESLPGSLEEEEEEVLVGSDHVVLIAWG